jgi:hypothetical protein
MIREIALGAGRTLVLCPVKFLAVGETQLKAAAPIMLVSMTDPVRVVAGETEHCVSPLAGLRVPRNYVVELDHPCRQSDLVAILSTNARLAPVQHAHCLVPQRSPIPLDVFDAILEVMERECVRAAGDVDDWIRDHRKTNRIGKITGRTKREALNQWSALAVEVEIELANAGRSAGIRSIHSKQELSRPIKNVRAALFRVMGHSLAGWEREFRLRRERAVLRQAYPALDRDVEAGFQRAATGTIEGVGSIEALSA